MSRPADGTHEPASGLREALEQVRGRHTDTYDDAAGTYCLTCRSGYPCPTRRIVDEALPATLPPSDTGDIGWEVTWQRADVLWSLLSDRLDPEQREGIADGVFAPLLQGLLALRAAPAQAAPPDALLGNQHDLADTICFLDGHERPEADCHCDGCADFAESAVACLSARAAALAAPAGNADAAQHIYDIDHMSEEDD